MSDVETLFLKGPFYIILAICFIVGIIRLIRFRKGKGTVLEKRKKYIIISLLLIIIPIMFVVSMELSGLVRRPHISEESIENSAELISEIFKQNEASNSDSVVHGSKSRELNLTTKDYTFLCNAICNKDVSSDYMNELIDEDSYFGEYGEVNGITYYCSPLYSNRGGLWSPHCGYFGRLYIVCDSNVYIISYHIYRRIDKFLGFFYAPPIGDYDIYASLYESEPYTFDIGFDAS